jgi:hypothetical protein
MNNTALLLHRTLCLMTSVNPRNKITFGLSFAPYAATHPGVAVHAVAKARMAEMYAKFKAIAAPPPWLPCAVGYILDMHVPLATSQCTDMFEAYSTGLAPEMCREYPVTLRNNEALIKDIWNSSDSTSTSNFKRLMRKGGPFQSSVRYVHSQLRRGLTDPLTRKCIATICRLSLLGAYPHCKVIAPPERRLQVYTKPDVSIIDMFASSNAPASNTCSHRYFYIIAEYVSSASSASPSIWSHVKQDTRYTAFDLVVRDAADLIRRHKKPPRVSLAAAPRTWTPAATMATMLQSVQLRKKLAAVSAGTISTADISRIYRNTILAPVVSVAASLEPLVGARSARDFAACKRETDQKKWFAKLTATQKVKVQVFCHGLVTRAAVVACPLSIAVKAAQQSIVARTKQTATHVTVCRACGTFRNKGLMSGTSRSTIGMQVTLPAVDQNSFRCNGCKHSWGLCRVDLVGNALYTRPKLDAPKRWIYLCASCGFPSESCSFDGILPTCSKCKLRVQTTTTTCFACTAVHSKQSMAAFDAVDVRDCPATFYACDLHNPNMLGLDTVSVQLVRQQVQLRSRHVSKSYRTKYY